MLMQINKVSVCERAMRCILCCSALADWHITTLYEG